MQTNHDEVPRKTWKKPVILFSVFFFLCLVALLLLIATPYFATRPLSRDSLTHANQH